MSSCPTARRCEREYLVGCDGGRSLIRKAAGIDFVGLDPSTSWMIAEVEMDEEPELGFRRDGVGTHAIGRRKAGGPIGVVLTERQVDHAGDPSMDELREALVGVYGTDYGLRSASWISRFTDMTRQAVVLPPAAGCCWPATPPTCIPRRAARASTSACRTP